MATSPPAASGRERRKSTRVPVFLPLRILGPGPVQSGTCMTISTGGARLLLERPYALGARLELELTLPDGPIAAVAEVVSVRGDRPNENGVRFEQLAPAALFAVHALIGSKR